MSKVFEALKDIKDTLQQIEYYNRDVKIDNSIYNSFDTIENALTTKSKKEQAFEIIKEKNVDVDMIKNCQTVIKYNWDIIFEEYKRKELNQEEYDLLKEVLKNE